MQSQPKSYLSPEAYLRLERQAATRSEYLDGEVFAMARSSEAHNLIATNLISSLGGQVKGKPCEVYSSNMRVKVSATGLYTYPDVVVVCGHPQFEDRQRDTLLNPTVIIEILSPSTESYDRGGKFDHYSSLASLTDYLLVGQQSPMIDHYARQPDGKWLLSRCQSLAETVHIASIGCDLALSDVYDQVEWPEVEPEIARFRRVKEEPIEYALRPGYPA
jgi:Uma2 family endonuclease